MFEYPIVIYAVIVTSIALDLVSGFAQAVYNHTLSSKKLRDGIFHKLSYFICIALVLMLEIACDYLDLGFSIELFVPLADYIVVTEAVSVVENLAKVNEELLDSPIFKLLAENKKRREDDQH